MTEIARLTLEKKSRDNAEPRKGRSRRAKRASIHPEHVCQYGKFAGRTRSIWRGLSILPRRQRGHAGGAGGRSSTISHENGCEYWLAAHSMVGEKMSGFRRPFSMRCASGLLLPDAKLQAPSVFTRIMVASRGKPTRQDLQVFLAAGFSETAVLEIILAIAVKTISNYSNHVFHTDVDPVRGVSLKHRRWHRAGNL
jgi:hypothetical protein